jgi:hypothetical protein
MVTHHFTAAINYNENVPIIDGEFDRFEINNDLEMQLREAETANFYHDAFNEEE